MNVDEAMEAAAEFRADMEARPAWTLFSETVAVVLATEVERLRAELAVEREAVKSLGNSFDKLRAELAAAKEASVCPVEVVACDPDYERTATVVLWSNADAQRFADWLLRDRMKEKGNQ